MTYLKVHFQRGTRYSYRQRRHHKVAQALLNALREACKRQGVGVLIALMANNDEAQRFYKSVEDASIHDTGIWIDIK